MYDNKFDQVEVASRSIPARMEIEEKYKWNLTDIFKSDDEWESDFKLVSDKIPGYKKFERTIADSAENLLECFRFNEEINIKLDQLHLYAMLSKDGDMRIGKYQSMDDRIKSLYSQVAAASAFIRPALLSISVTSKEEGKGYTASLTFFSTSVLPLKSVVLLLVVLLS